MTALSKKPPDEKVLVGVGSAPRAVTANKRMAGTVAARVHLVLIKVLVEAAEVSVEMTIQVLHVVSVVEAVADLAKVVALEEAAGAALGVKLKMTRNKMALEGSVQNVVVASEVVVVVVVAVGLVAAAAAVGLVAAVAVALGRVVVVAVGLAAAAVVALEVVVVVVFQVVMMGKMVVAEVVALAVVVVDVGSVGRMVTLQENVLKRKIEAVVEVEELVMVVVKRGT